MEENKIKPVMMIGNHGKKILVPYGQYLSFQRNGFISKNKEGKEVLNIYEEKKKDTKTNPARLFTRLSQAEEFIKIQPLYYDKSRIWWMWDKDETFWKIIDETDILNMVSEVLELDVVPSKTRNEIIQALEMVSRKNKPVEIPKTLIQFKNGLVDINSPESILEPNSSYFITNTLPYEYGEIGETPTIDRIFKEWVGEDYVQTLYEILAYSIIPDYPIHRIFCFIGVGLNGKSKFLELLRKFIGNDNCCSTELDVLLNSRFEVTRLHKKLVCQMGETNFSEMNKTSMLKKLSGGDLIGFEYKRKDPFEDKNYAKIIIATNNLPATSDKTVGFYRRWLIIDFPNQFSEKKDILDEIPEIEFSNLGKKCINILKGLLKKREFTREGSIEDRMKKYQDHSDPLEKFIKEYIEEDSDGFIWKFEFEKKLNEWCKENRFRQLSEVAIGKKMKERGIQQELRTADWLTDGSNKRYRAWINIKFSDKDKQLQRSDQDEQEEQVIST